MNAAKEVLDHSLVVDRYHVAKKFRDGADQVRKQEIKRLNRELSEAQYETIKEVM